MKMKDFNGFVHIFALDVNAVRVIAFSKSLEQLTQIVADHRIHFSRMHSPQATATDCTSSTTSTNRLRLELTVWAFSASSGF